MVGGKDGNNLGPWQGADLLSTVRTDAGTGADSNAPHLVRFRSSIVKLVRRRRALCHAALEIGRASVFLLKPSPPSTAAYHEPQRVPRLDNGMHEIHSKVWFVGAGPGSGHFILNEHEDDDRLFRFVTEELELHDVPAIIFDPRHPEFHIRYYPNGLVDIDNFEDVVLSAADVSVETVSAAIEKTHLEKMITPDAQPPSLRLWADHNKWIPYKDAEARVQAYLEIALNTAFPTCVVRPEQTLPEGRLDIEIVENDPVDRSKIVQHGILELKVLRSFHRSGTKVPSRYTDEWIHSGVEQAAAYRESKGARWSALVCFDMRCADEGDVRCFSHVFELAGRLEVHLKRWFIYGSSKQLRSARTAAKG